MGKQIIKQPNGRYCIFSTIVDNFVLTNAEESDIIDYLVNQSRRIITKEVQDTISQLNEGEKPYFQFTMTFEEACELIKEIHPK